jgi:2-polyprenyl-6-methoxyphenol hydroxylase-like FAD-dependent oxidoreductase
MTAAHALHRAGIDFGLLEVRLQLEIDGGFYLTASAMGMRALGQFALVPDMEKGSTQFTKLQRHDHGGKDTEPK